MQEIHLQGYNHMENFGKYLTTLYDHKTLGESKGETLKLRFACLIHNKGLRICWVH